MRNWEKQPPGLTVLICSYNGAARIGETLKHLAEQQLSSAYPWEVILVDNGSRDGTGAVAGNAWQELNAPAPLLSVNQPLTGKSNALELGFEMARYPYVIICDDDNWLAPDYLQNAVEIIDANPEIGVLGGRGEAVFEAPPPVWFPRFCTYYAVGPQYPNSGDVTAGKGIIWGAGAVVRKEAYEKLKTNGYRRFLTWQNVGKLARSEDGEFCLAVRLAGYRIWYDDRLRYRHWMEASRLNWPYLMGLVKDGARVKPIFDLYRMLADPPERAATPQAFWLHRGMSRSLRPKFIKTAWQLVTAGSREGNADDQASTFYVYDTLSLFYWRNRYNHLHGQLLSLKKKMQQEAPGK